MKKIGLVGGISWSSTIDYYKLMNEEVNRRRGGLHFAECIIYSLDFQRFQASNAAGDWNGTQKLLSDAAMALERAGAAAIVLCANTAHKVAESVGNKLTVPLIDIRTAVINAVQNRGLTKVGLLGTVYTMEMDFYRSHFTEAGIVTLVPEAKQERDYIEHTLLHQLGKGIILENTRAKYIEIINELVTRGAEGIILGCTEIPLLIRPQDVPLPTFNTTEIHVNAAVAFALG